MNKKAMYCLATTLISFNMNPASHSAKEKNEASKIAKIAALKEHIKTNKPGITTPVMRINSVPDSFIDDFFSKPANCGLTEKAAIAEYEYWFAHESHGNN